MYDPTKPPTGDLPDVAGAGPARYSPDAYIITVAEQMAGPFWPNLTDEQRRKLERYAAGYVATAAKRFAEAEVPTGGASFTALPDNVKRTLMQAHLDANVYRTRLHVLLAYLASREDAEIQPYELRTLAKLGDTPDSLPFF